MSKADELKVKAFDLTMELDQIQQSYAVKAQELEKTLEEIKQCPK